MRRSNLLLVAVIPLFVLVAGPGLALADVKSKAAREAAEYVLSKFGKEAAEQGAERLAARIDALALRHGEEAFQAVRKVGPRAFRVVEEAGENGTKAVKLMARYGDDAAVWVIARPQAMAIVSKYGDDAAKAIIKHKGIAEPVIEGFGESGLRALQAVNPQNARRITMMMSEGELAKIGRTSEVLEVVGKYGDRAMDFVWRNKGSLAVAAGLTAFLANPQPFFDGAVSITKTTAENVVKPIANVPGQIATELAKGTNWTIVVVCVVLIAGVLLGARMWGRHRATLAKTAVR